jgi:undecaprenyl-diphosphatase
MDFLYSIDKAVFYFFNRTISNSVLDWFMPFVTNAKHWTVPIVLIYLYLILFGGKRGRITALLVVVILLFTDQIVNFVIKPLAGRERPCFMLEHVRLLIRQPHSRSFPSSHAANMASMAALFSIQYRKYAAWFASAALVIGVSRMYVGVHYPSDVAAGFAVGILFALPFVWIERRIENHLSEKQGTRNVHPSSKKRRVHEKKDPEHGR